MSAETTNRLSVSLFTEESAWVAQCLEIDIAGHGKNPKAALESLARTVAAQIAFDEMRGLKPLAHLEAAPDEYRRAFHEAAWKVPLNEPFPETLDFRPDEIRLLAA